MCGIVGLQGPQDTGWIAAMNAAQHHRGPDDGGCWQCPQYGLSIAMRRLSIIDIAGGVQPMVSTDGRYALVYNGEIFNARELRRELEAEGDRFTTDHSDTEVLFRLLIREGGRCAAKLNGMFAFAFVDKAEGTLLLARDRFGIKPLHYAETDGRFAFASEIKSLLTLPFLDQQPDLTAAFHYFSLHYVPGTDSAYRSIRRLPPATLLTRNLATGAIHTERYWRLTYDPEYGHSADDWRVEIAGALRSAVNRWAWSDVPVAVSLSGGLDSSAIAGLAASEGISVSSISLGFSAPDESAWNELPLARKVAEKWGLEHEEIILQPDALIDALPTMVASLDEPYAGGLPSWFVFEAMARRVKVALTGVGGDEMFGNYGKWLGLERRWFGRFGRRKASAVSPDLFRDRLVDRYYYATDEWKRGLMLDPPPPQITTSGILYAHFADAVNDDGQTLRDAWAVTDIETQLSDEFLMMTDRFSMAHGLEARTPFLDANFVDVVRRIPADVRTRSGDLKGLLREAVAPLLPRELLNAPKRGFVIPLGQWMRGRLRPLVEDLLGDAAIKKQGLFRLQTIAPLRQEHLAGHADHTGRLWPLLMFQLWALPRP